MTAQQRPPSPERDPLVDNAWRAHSTELPPPSVDAAILAAAHREVASRPRAAGDEDALAEAREPSRWWWGLAAAAAIGAIAFGLVQLAPFGPAHDPTRATDLPPESDRQQPPVRAKASAELASDTGTSEDAARTSSAARRPATIGHVPASAPASSTEVARAPATGPAPAAEAAPATAAVNASAPSPAPKGAGRPGRNGESPVSAAPASPAAAPPPQRAATAATARERTEAIVPPPAPPASPPAPSVTLVRPEAPVAAPSPQPFPAAAPPTVVEKSEAAVAPARARQDAADAAAKRAAPLAGAQASAGAAASTERPVALRSPEEFVRSIREHYDAGRLEVAARELRAFRETYADADAKLPPALRAWAATIQK